MSIKKIGPGIKYVVESDFDDFDESLKVVVDFGGDRNSFWEKHILREGEKGSSKALGRSMLNKDLDDIDDLDEIEAVLEMNSRGVSTASNKSTIIKLKHVPADTVIYNFAKCLASNCHTLGSKWSVGSFFKILPEEVIFSTPNCITSYDGSTKTKHRSMCIGAKLVAKNGVNWTFSHIHCNYPGNV